MITSESGEIDNPSTAVSKSTIDKVVAIPFPVCPRRVHYGPLAKVLDFLTWKNRLNSEADHSINKTLEEIAKLSIAEQKLWLIRRILEIYDYGDRKDLYNLCEILYEESPDRA